MLSQALILGCLFAFVAHGAETTQRPYSQVFEEWGESVKQEIYAGYSVIFGNQALLEELKSRAGDNMPFLKSQLPNYFFAVVILDGAPGAIPEDGQKAEERVIIARYHEDEDNDRPRRPGRAGGLLLFHNILGAYHVDGSGWIGLSVPQSRVESARKLIREAVARGEFSITLLPETPVER